MVHGTEFRPRWKLLRERVLAMKRLWTEDEAVFAGDRVRFEPSWAWRDAGVRRVVLGLPSAPADVVLAPPDRHAPLIGAVR
jgi:hypothetical protein